MSSTGRSAGCSGGLAVEQLDDQVDVAAGRVLQAWEALTNLL
jgi:hypothetical protein